MLTIFPSPPNLLAQMAALLLPLPHDPARARHLARTFCQATPRLQRWLLAVTIGAFLLAGRLSRRGAPTREIAVVAWVGWAAVHPWWVLRSLGLWLKATAALLVLGDSDTRAKVAGFASDGPKPASATSPLHATHASQATRPGLPVADYVIVGTGPAGATVARTLARAGHSVLMLEEGDAPLPAERDEAFATTLARRFRSAGTLATVGDAPMPVLQGRGVGGSSVVNSAIAWRAPEAILGLWHADPHIASALPLARWEQAYGEIEQIMPVTATPQHVWGPNNALMAQACQKLGMAGEPTPRYTVDCEGTGRCMEGCPKAHKQAMHLTLIPQAEAAGARVWSGARVVRAHIEQGRARGVWTHADGTSMFVSARRGVVLAASAVQSPILLRQSGVQHPCLGQRFQAHPGVSVAARFPQRIRNGLNATQGYDSTHLASHGVKLETLHLPEELLATRYPGVGAPWADKIAAALPHTALWAALVRAEAHGSVGGSAAMPMIHYTPTARDAQRLALGIRTLCGMFLAVGAEAVWPGVAGFAPEITNMDALRGLEDHIKANQLTMIASHLFGTAVMGGSAAESVCDPYGRVHGVPGLWVADSSLFPTNLGVNPQHTIMAVAQHVAWGMLEQT